MRRDLFRIVAALALAWLMGANPAEAACDDPPAPGVDWSHCDKRGADLSGADLQRADLTQADLSGADLTEANLWRATLSGAKLDGAILKGTSWWEGTICSDRSVGKCWKVHTGP